MVSSVNNALSLLNYLEEQDIAIARKSPLHARYVAPERFVSDYSPMGHAARLGVAVPLIVSVLSCTTLGEWGNTINDVAGRAVERLPHPESNAERTVRKAVETVERQREEEQTRFDVPVNVAGLDIATGAVITADGNIDLIDRESGQTTGVPVTATGDINLTAQDPEQTDIDVLEATSTGAADLTAGNLTTLVEEEPIPAVVTVVEDSPLASLPRDVTVFEDYEPIDLGTIPTLDQFLTAKVEQAKQYKDEIYVERGEIGTFIEGKWAQVFYPELKKAWNGLWIDANLTTVTNGDNINTYNLEISFRLPKDDAFSTYNIGVTAKIFYKDKGPELIDIDTDELDSTDSIGIEGKLSKQFTGDIESVQYRVALRHKDGGQRIYVSSWVKSYKETPPPLAPNSAPEITSNPITAATADVLYQYDADATDAEGDTLTWALIKSPTGMYIGPLNGLISWTPTAEQGGLSDVEVQVTDDSLKGPLTDTQSYVISTQVVPAAPEDQLVLRRIGFTGTK